MVDRIWRWTLIAALAISIVWMKADQAEMEERYRDLVERQDRIDRLIDSLPAMIETAMARHRAKMMAYIGEMHDD